MRKLSAIGSFALPLLFASTAASAATLTTDCPTASRSEYVALLTQKEDFQPFKDRVERAAGTVERLSETTEKLVLVTLPTDSQTDRRLIDILDEEKRNNHVADYEPNSAVTLFQNAIDSDFDMQCGLKAIRAPAAWGNADPMKADQIKVAIVDSGAYHDDFKDNLVFYDTDFDGHGTHLAGIIGAKPHNGGTVGVVWKVRLYAYRFNRGDLAHALGKLVDALDADPNIVLLAWGTKCKSDLLEGYIKAKLSKVLFVAAAGNGGVDLGTSPVYPAAFSSNNLLTVMATTCDGGKAPFSSYGQTVEVAAPGASGSGDTCNDVCQKCPHGILSTVLNSRYCCQMGTSMASAFVAGAAALVWSHQTSPSPENVKNCLLKSGVLLPGTYPCKRLDLARAVDGSLTECK